MRKPARRPIQSASSGSNLLGVGGHLLVQLVAEPAALRLERRQVGGRERHEERLLPVVRHEAVARVQVAELLVGVNLFLGLVRADVAERERGGLQHAVAGRVAGRPGRPWPTARAARRAVAFSTAVAVCSSMNDTSSSRDWNLSVGNGCGGHGNTS